MESKSRQVSQCLNGEENVLIEQLERLAGFGFGKVGFAFYLIGGVGFSNVIRKPTSNCSTEPDIQAMREMWDIGLQALSKY